MDTITPIVVLYIEDDHNTAEMFEMLVKRAQEKSGQSVQILWAGSLTEGVIRLHTIPKPNLVILDLTLPDSIHPMSTAAYITQFKAVVGDDNVCVLSGNPDKAVKDAVARLNVRFVDKTTGLLALVHSGFAELFSWWPESRLARQRREMVTSLQNRVAAIQSHTQQNHAPH